MTVHAIICPGGGCHAKVEVNDQRLDRRHNGNGTATVVCGRCGTEVLVKQRKRGGGIEVVSSLEPAVPVLALAPG